jgi:hypothetical protein
MPPAVLAPVRPSFRALAVTLCPEAEALDADGWTRAEALIDDALARRPPAQARQLRLFVRLAGTLLPLLRYGRTFGRLDARRRTRLLETLETAPIQVVRRGVWGLRTLVYLGVYGQDDVRRALGFRGRPQGWDARPGARPAGSP